MDTTPARRPPPSPELVHLLEELRTARFALGLSCPRCGCERTHRWGSFSGRQRYRCLGCRRTFSDLTATPAAYSKKLLLWRDYGQCLAEGASVRHAARRVRVHPATAFRWRHALLGTLLECEETEQLAGWVELCSLTLLYSEKGRRRTRAREARPRPAAPSEPGAWGARLLARVLVACDRRGRTVTGVAGISRTARIPTHELERILEGRIEGRAHLVAADGPLSPAATLARRAGWRFHDARLWARGAARARSLVHVRTAEAYVARFLDWLERFRGVATRYLPNYLAWHRALDRQWRRRVQAELLRWPLGRSAPPE